MKIKFLLLQTFVKHEMKAQYEVQKDHEPLHAFQMEKVVPKALQEAQHGHLAVGIPLPAFAAKLGPRLQRMKAIAAIFFSTNSHNQKRMSTNSKPRKNISSDVIR